MLNFIRHLLIKKSKRIMLHREIADQNFSNSNHSAALSGYCYSIKEGEEGIIYSYLNGAMLACAMDRFLLAAKWLKTAEKIKENDPIYYKQCEKRILNKLRESIRRDLYEYLIKIFSYKKRDVAYSDFECMVLGFPRCGTTSVADAIAQDMNLRSGLVEESLDNINLSSKREKLWSHFLESFHYIDSIDGNESENTKFIDKSTCISLSKELMLDLNERFPNAAIFICKRDGFDRSISAYKRCENSGNWDFLSCVKKEILLIKQFGGITKIFNSLAVLRDFNNSMAALSLSYPIVYPTMVMENYAALMHDVDTDNLTFFNIDTKEISGKTPEMDLSELQQLNTSTFVQIENQESLKKIFLSLLKTLTLGSDYFTNRARIDVDNVENSFIEFKNETIERKEDLIRKVYSDKSDIAPLTSKEIDSKQLGMLSKHTPWGYSFRISKNLTSFKVDQKAVASENSEELRMGLNGKIIDPTVDLDLHEMTLRISILEDIFSKYSMKKDRWLDVATNCGIIPILISRSREIDTIGIDLDDENIKKAKIINEISDSKNKVKFYQSDAYEYLSNLDDESFEITSALGLFYHLTDPIGLMSSIYRVTKRVAIIDTIVHNFPFSGWIQTVSRHTKYENLRHANDARKIIELHPTYRGLIDTLFQVGFKEVINFVPSEELLQSCPAQIYADRNRTFIIAIK